VTTKTPLTDLCTWLTNALTDRKSAVADYWMTGIFCGGLVTILGGASGLCWLLIAIFILDCIELSKKG